MGDLSYDVVINYISKGNPAAKIGDAGAGERRAQEQWARRREQIQTNSALYAGRLAEKQVREEFAARRRAEKDHERYRMELRATSGRVAQGAMSGAGGLLSGAADAAFSIAGGAAKWATAGALAGISFGVHFNQEIEAQQIGIAGIFQANGAPDFATALGASGKIIEKMQKDAALLPGTFKELSQTFQSIATPGLQAGMSINETEKFAANTLAMGVTNMLPARVAAREMRAMMQGQVHSQNILAQMMLPQMGMDIHSFNKLDPKARLTKINEVFSKYGDAFTAYGKSFVGLGTTITSNFSILAGKVTKPVFEDIKNTMQEVIEYMTTHKAEIDDWADRIGGKLHLAFMKVHDVVKSLIPMIVTLTGKVEDFLSNGGLSKIGRGLEIAGGMKLAGAGMSALGAGGAETALVALEAAALPAAAALLMTAGAVTALGDSDYMFHKQALDAWIDIQSTGTSVLQKVQRDAEVAWENLKMFSTFGLENLGTVGLVLTEVMVNLANSFSLVKTGIAGVLTPFLGAGGADIAADLLTHDSGLGQADPHKRGIRTSTGGYNPFDEFLNQLHEVKAPNHTTHIHKVDIIIRPNEDPSRIARLTKDALVNLGRTAGTSTSAPNFSRVQR